VDGTVKIRNQNHVNLRYGEVKPFYLRSRCICERLHSVTCILIFMSRLRYGNGLYVKGPLRFSPLFFRSIFLILSKTKSNINCNYKKQVVFTLGDFYEVNPKNSPLANLTLCVASSYKIILWPPPTCHVDLWIKGKKNRKICLVLGKLYQAV
jgi:hypothetical protein